MKLLFRNMLEYSRVVFMARRAPCRLLVVLITTLLILGSTSGCHSNDDSPKILYFPVQETPFTKVEPTLLLGILEGKLVLVNGYLRLERRFLFWNTSPSHLVIWPFGYSWMTENNQIWILNEKSEKIARVGNCVKIGGGEIGVSPDSLKGSTGEDPPKGTTGPFWLMSEILSD
jgi:hypothetical protein